MRANLSRPVRLMLRHGLLTRRDSFFDYGCGQGDDVRMLRMLGIRGSGWDPIHGPRPSLVQSNIVNLGYVLNFVSDPQDRCEALRAAWAMAKRLLTVTVPVEPQPKANCLKVEAIDEWPLKRKKREIDRLHREWQRFIDGTLAIDSVAAGLGVFYLFRGAHDRDDFLAKKTKAAAKFLLRDISQQAGFGPSPGGRFRRDLCRRHMLQGTATYGLCTFGILANAGRSAYAQGIEFAQQTGTGSADIADRVKGIVVEHLGVDESEVGDRASFVDDLGADSLDTVELVMAFEEEFGIEIPDDDAEKIVTVKDAIDFVTKATDRTD